MNEQANRWRRCSVCKADIMPGATYHVCNVSTCNRKGKESVFCTEACWEAHLAVMNHREAWSETRIAPK